MKIAIISFYSGHIERGAEIWAHELAERLSKNHQVVVFQNQAESKKHTYKIRSTAISIDWNKSESRGSLKRVFFIDYWSILVAKFTFKILPDLWREKFDIVIPTNGGWQASFIRILTWLAGNRMIIVNLSGQGWDERINLWNFPDIFVALTKSAKAWVKKVNPFVRVELIPNGVDLKKFTPEGKRLSLRIKEPLVLCVGALSSTKRIHLAIKAIAGIKKVSLLVIGQGDLQTEIKNLGEKLLGNRFYMMNLPFEKMPQVYRVADIFTLPTWEIDAFAAVYLEAMASGLGVVATNDEIRREIIGDAGILVDPENTKEYASAIEEALSKNWGDRPRKQAEKFSWNVIAKRYEELFETLLRTT